MTACRWVRGQNSVRDGVCLWLVGWVTVCRVGLLQRVVDTYHSVPAPGSSSPWIYTTPNCTQVVANPSAIFLSDRDLAPNVSSAVAGAAVNDKRLRLWQPCLAIQLLPSLSAGRLIAPAVLPPACLTARLPAVVLEGTRPMLMEVQALCSPVPHGSGQPPMRMPSGVNRDRLALLLAVLGKHTEMRPYSVDVHMNVTGGARLWVCAVLCCGLLRVAAGSPTRGSCACRQNCLPRAWTCPPRPIPLQAWR